MNGKGFFSFLKFIVVFIRYQQLPWTCTLHSSTSAKSFTYSASGMCSLFPISIDWYIFRIQPSWHIQLWQPTSFPPAHARFLVMDSTLCPVGLQMPPLLPRFYWVDVQFVSLHHYDCDWWPFLPFRANFINVVWHRVESLRLSPPDRFLVDVGVINGQFRPCSYVGAGKCIILAFFSVFALLQC